MLSLEVWYSWSCFLARLGTVKDRLSRVKVLTSWTRGKNMQQPEAAFMQVVLQPLKNQPSIGRKKKICGWIEDAWTCEHSLKPLPTPEVLFTFFRLLGHTLVWIVHLCLWLFIGVDVLSWIKLNLRCLCSHDFIRKDDVECKLYLIFSPTALVARPVDLPRRAWITRIKDVCKGWNCGKFEDFHRKAC